MNILIVDDSKAMRMLIIRSLREAGFSGHTYIEAQNGVEALNVINSSTPDVILSDWNMPEMNGIELLDKLQTLIQNKEIRKIPFVFVTSESTIEMKQKAESLGASNFINKPFTPEVFERALVDIIQ